MAESGGEAMHLSRKAAIVSAAVGVALAGGVTGALAATSHAGTNGIPGVRGAPTAVSCAIRNDTGQAVSSISIDRLQGADHVYWLNYSPASGATVLTFKVTPANSTDPLTLQTQKFRTSGPVITPFGIPYWAGNATTGFYHLHASDNAGGSANCTFYAS
jgi:hypothetical protein